MQRRGEGRAGDAQGRSAASQCLHAGLIFGRIFSNVQELTAGGTDGHSRENRVIRPRRGALLSSGFSLEQLEKVHRRFLVNVLPPACGSLGTCRHQPWLGLCRKATFQVAFQGCRSTRRAFAAGSSLLSRGARWQLDPGESCSQPGFTARNVVSQDGFPVTRA